MSSPKPLVRITTAIAGKLALVQRYGDVSFVRAFSKSMYPKGGYSCLLQFPLRRGVCIFLPARHHGLSAVIGSKSQPFRCAQPSRLDWAPTCTAVTNRSWCSLNRSDAVVGSRGHRFKPGKKRKKNPRNGNSCSIKSISPRGAWPRVEGTQRISGA